MRKVSRQASHSRRPFACSFRQPPLRKLAQQLLLGAALLLVVVTGARAHEFIVIDEQDNETKVPAGSTSQVNLSGSMLTIRVMNDGTETGCTTQVKATVQGAAVGVEQDGGGLGSTRTISYTTPPDNHGDIIVKPVRPGTARVTAEWTITRTSQSCAGGNEARFDFTVIGKLLKLTNAQADNPQSWGDPVFLATGESHEDDQVFVAIFGTGMRGAAGPATATVGGEATAVLGPVPHAVFEGLDQANLGALSRALAGRGDVDINFTVDGKAANTVSINIL